MKTTEEEKRIASNDYWDYMEKYARTFGLVDYVDENQFEWQLEVEEDI